MNEVLFSEVFLKIINMSISASWLALVVLLMRAVLKKAPKWVSVLLWGFVALRLICPFSIESMLSLIPSAETVSPEIMMDWTPEISTGIGSLDTVVNPIISDVFAPKPYASANPLQILILVAAIVWLLGVAAMLLYTAASYLLLCRKVATAVLLRKNIYQSENVESPFVLGIIKPKIYLPFRMDSKDLAYVVAHEESHIRRKDHWWKPFGFMLLALHWFNPLMWLGYVLLCKDIELACDEKVIKTMDNENRADYTQALVACSINRRRIAACPLAFGEVGVKARVKSVMNYKKPAFWMMILVLILCAAIAVCFLTDPVPYIRNPWVREYIPGGDGIIGSVDKGRYESISKDFAIGADRYGRAVFKDPNRAFDTLTELYAEGIALVQEQNDLAPISRKNYSAYKKLGWQTTSGSEIGQEQARFVSKFLDIYENSFTKDTPAPNTEIPTSDIVSSFKMVPTDTRLEGLHAGILLLPLDGKTYRYDLTDNKPGSVTADALLYKFKEPDTFQKYIEWEVSSLKEYPDRSVVMLRSQTEAWLCVYSPPLRCTDTALDDAIQAGYAVMEDGTATHGQDVWNTFYDLTRQGKAATITVAHYQTLDPARCETAYYEACKQDYPYLNVYRLSYDGETYTLSFADGGKQHAREFAYLMRYKQERQTLSNRAYTGTVTHYVLTHDDKLTWDQLWKSVASSQWDAYIDHYPIYTEKAQS